MFFCENKSKKLIDRKKKSIFVKKTEENAFKQKCNQDGTDASCESGRRFCSEVLSFVIALYILYSLADDCFCAAFCAGVAETCVYGS